MWQADSGSRGANTVPRDDVDFPARGPQDLRFAHRSQHGPRVEQVRVKDDAHAHRADTDHGPLTFAANEDSPDVAAHAKLFSRDSSFVGS